jgi:fibronectin-binding autotransporter adhesin
MGSANITIIHSKTLGTAKDSSAYDINSPEWNAAHLSTITNIDADSLGGKAASAYLTGFTQTNQSAVAQINGSSGSVSFVAGSNITLSQSQSNITINAAPTGLASDAGSRFLNVSASTYGTNISMTLGSNAISISAPSVGGAQTGISGIAGSGASTASSGTVQFANSNGLTFGLNGNTITASHNALTTQTSLVFSNTNGVTFGTSGSTLTASVEDISLVAGSNVTLSTNGASTTVIVGGGIADYVQSINSSTGAIVFTAGSNITLSQSQSTITIIGASGGGGGVGLQGSGSSVVTSGNVQFANSNGLTFGLSGSTITASHNGLTAAMASDAGSKFLNTGTTGATNCSITLSSNGLSVNVHAPIGIAGSGASTVSSGNVQFANSNGLTFGMNGSTITASHNGLTAAMASDAGTKFLNTGTTGATNCSITLSSNGLSVNVHAPIGIAGSGASTVSSGNVQFANSNGLTFGLNGSTITASHNGLTAAMASNAGSNFLNIGTTGATNCSVTLSSNNLAVNVPSMSHGLSAAGASASNGTLVLSNSNNVSFGMNGSTITCSASFASTTINSYNGGIAGGGSTYTSGTVLLSGSNGVLVTASGANQTIIIAGHAHNFGSSGASSSWNSSAGTATNQAKLLGAVTITPINSDNNVSLDAMVVLQLTTTGGHTFNWWRSNAGGQTVIGFPMHYVIQSLSASMAATTPLRLFQVDSPAVSSAVTYNLYVNGANSKTVQCSGLLLIAQEF